MESISAKQLLIPEGYKGKKRVKEADDVKLDVAEDTDKVEMEGEHDAGTRMTTGCRSSEHDCVYEYGQGKENLKEADGVKLDVPEDTGNGKEQVKEANEEELDVPIESDETDAESSIAAQGHLTKDEGEKEESYVDARMASESQEKDSDNGEMENGDFKITINSPFPEKDCSPVGNYVNGEIELESLPKGGHNKEHDEPADSSTRAESPTTQTRRDIDKGEEYPETPRTTRESLLEQGHDQDGKGKEKVNEANVVQIIIARDNDKGEEHLETLGTTRESPPEKGHDKDGKGKEKVYEANVVQIIIARDKDESVDSSTHVEASTSQTRRNIDKGEGRLETPGTTRESPPEKAHDQDNDKGEEHPETSGATSESLAEIGHDQDNGEGEIQEDPLERELIFNYACSLVENVKEKCSIHKVHSGLRKESAKHYEPVLVSIGPYHYRKRPVQDMEKHKIDYKEVLLHRVKENSIYTYKKALEDERGKPRALDCYVDSFRMDVDSFKECMLRDGFFMIELFWRKKNFDQSKDSSNDILFNIRWMKPRLARDMLLFENQIPLLVLRAMFSLTEQSTEQVDFVPLVLNFFEFNGKTITCDENLTNRLGDIPHLLGLVYEALVFGNKRKDLVPGPSVQLNMEQKLVKWLIGAGLPCKEENDSVPGPPVQLNGMRLSLKSLTWTVFVRLIKKPFSLKQAQQQNHDQKSCEFIRTGRALEQVGVTFVREEDNVAFYDIKFSSTGELSIPRLVIDDNTESFFRNLVAYEQYSEKNRLHQVGDYLHVMDCLINSAKDVELLRHCGIIDNRIGDDKKVSTMFNRLCSDVYFSQSEFLYRKMFDDVNKFCMDSTNAWKATLKNEYFGSPWSIISFVAAVLLLLFTATQTVYSVLSYHHSSS